MINYIYIGLFIIGLIAAYYATVHYKDTKLLLETGEKTRAEVVHLIPKSSDEGGYTYAPVFEYTDKFNTLKTYTSSISSKPASYAIGETVQIIYDPNDDENVKIISFWGLYRWTLILACIAFPFLSIGGGYLLYINK